MITDFLQMYDTAHTVGQISNQGFPLGVFL